MDTYHIRVNNQKHYRKQNIETNIMGWVGIGEAWIDLDQDWDKW
jgi:biotin synthase-like enzyme